MNTAGALKEGLQEFEFSSNKDVLQFYNFRKSNNFSERFEFNIVCKVYHYTRDDAVRGGHLLNKTVDIEETNTNKLIV